MNNKVTKRLLFLWLLAVASCFAMEDLFFVIKKIEIKQKDENSLSAKQKALVDAARLAFYKLISEKLNKDIGIVEKVSDAQIQECIYDYSVENEKYSDSFYIAELSYRFSKEKVANLLQSYGIGIDYVRKVKSNEKVEIAIYGRDYLKYFNELQSLGILVKSFSNETVIFSMNKENINNFLKLRMNCAQLQ